MRECTTEMGFAIGSVLQHDGLRIDIKLGTEQPTKAATRDNEPAPISFEVKACRSGPFGSAKQREQSALVLRLSIQPATDDPNSRYFRPHNRRCWWR
jgi:hypothetical protein